MVQINFQESALTFPLKGSGLSFWEHCPPFIIVTCKRETYKHPVQQVMGGNINKARKEAGGEQCCLDWVLGPAHSE